jgi:tetratricopeptide (TPR) repeat protein
MDTHPYFEQAPKRRRRRQKDNPKTNRKHDGVAILTRVIGGALVVVTLLAAFLAGRESVLRTSEISEGASEYVFPVSMANQAHVDSKGRREAMEVFGRGLKLAVERNYYEAEKAFRRTAEIDPSFPGVHFQLGRLLAERRRDVDSMEELDKSLQLNEERSDSYILKAKLFARKDAMQEAERAFELATQAAPASSAPFFEWGEFLRERGKFLEAMEKLQAAAIRAVGEPNEVAIESKLHLALLESENAEWIENTLKPHLAEEDQSIEWLLAGGVYAMQQKDWATARERFAAARAQTTPEFYAWFIRDKFFDLHRTNPELIGFLSPRTSGH